MITGDWDYPQEHFNITFEKGEGSNHERTYEVDPSGFAVSLGFPGAGTEVAIYINYYVNVRLPNLDITLTAIPDRTSSTATLVSRVFTSSLTSLTEWTYGSQSWTR